MKTETFKVCAFYFFLTFTTNVKNSPIPDEVEQTTLEFSWEFDTTTTTTTTPRAPIDYQNDETAEPENVQYADNFLEFGSNEETSQTMDKITTSSNNPSTPLPDVNADNFNELLSSEDIPQNNESTNSSNNPSTPLPDINADNFNESNSEDIPQNNVSTNSSNNPSTPLPDVNADNFNELSSEDIPQNNVSTNSSDYPSTPLPDVINVDNFNELSSEDIPQNNVSNNSSDYPSTPLPDINADNFNELSSEDISQICDIFKSSNNSNTTKTPLTDVNAENVNVLSRENIPYSIDNTKSSSNMSTPGHISYIRTQFIMDKYEEINNIAELKETFGNFDIDTKGYDYLRTYVNEVLRVGRNELEQFQRKFNMEIEKTGYQRISYQKNRIENSKNQKKFT